MWLVSENIGCVHGFSTRHGGVSPAPFHSLNLGGSEDKQENIAKNRALALNALKLSTNELCFLKQVHGTTVCTASPGQQEGDALVSNQKNLALAISIADCYPILFHDPVNGVIGAAHAGWRGTVSGISTAVIDRMKALGADPETTRVAIGQGISQARFEVGEEVIEQFKKNGFPESCRNKNHLDLIKCNIFTLQKNGISLKNIWTMNRCTFEDDFFSYRRDKGVTGRMWAVIAML
jgi:YfiH family protein